MASISQSDSETASENIENVGELLSVLAKSASLQSLNVPFREKCANKPDAFDKVFVDIKHLEEEIEALKWLARRKEMEWDCARQMIHQKKADIKVVKRKINMVKTVNDLGEQVNVDSDDEDTPFEDSSDSEQSMDEEDKIEEEGNRYSLDDENEINVQATARRKESHDEKAFVSQRDKNVRFVMAHTNNQRQSAVCLYCKEKPPLFVCGHCKDKAYCSQDCQKLHWAVHEEYCQSYRKNDGEHDSRNLTIVPKLGDLKQMKNADHYDEKQEFHVQSSKCLGCLEANPKFLCSACNNAWYCSMMCQKSHWTQHEIKCSQMDN